MRLLQKAGGPHVIHPIGSSHAYCSPINYYTHTYGTVPTPLRLRSPEALSRLWPMAEVMTRVFSVIFSYFPVCSELVGLKGSGLTPLTTMLQPRILLALCFVVPEILAYTKPNETC